MAEPSLDEVQALPQLKALCPWTKYVFAAYSHREFSSHHQQLAFSKKGLFSVAGEPNHR